MKQNILHRLPDRFGLLLALLAVYLFFALAAPASFATLRNIETISRQTVIVGIAAIGMTYVIIAGGIDLSVGSVVALSSVLTAWFLNRAGIGPAAAALGAMFVTGLSGVLTGVLVTRLKMSTPV